MKTTTLNLEKYQDEGHLRQKIFRSLLNSEVDVSGKWVADVGAGPCAFSRIASEFGAEVFAVDARAERVPGNIFLTTGCGPSIGCCWIKNAG